MKLKIEKHDAIWHHGAGIEFWCDEPVLRKSLKFYSSFVWRGYIIPVPMWSKTEFSRQF